MMTNNSLRSKSTKEYMCGSPSMTQKDPDNQYCKNKEKEAIVAWIKEEKTKKT